MREGLPCSRPLGLQQITPPRTPRTQWPPPSAISPDHLGNSHRPNYIGLSRCSEIKRQTTKQGLPWDRRAPGSGFNAQRVGESMAGLYLGIWGDQSSLAQDTCVQRCLLAGMPWPPACHVPAHLTAQGEDTERPMLSLSSHLCGLWQDHGVGSRQVPRSLPCSSGPCCQWP